jgi:hypothetical protein
MGVPVITGQENARTGKAIAAVHRRNGGREAHQIVELARRYTQSAIRKMALLMEGKAGKIKTLDKDGTLVEIDIEVPASVQLKAAETLVERGWGKAPIAVLLSGGGLLNGDDKKTLTVAEKIIALSQAQETKDQTVDLEASEQQEIDVLALPSGEEDDRREILVEEEAAPASAADMI